MNHAPLHEVFCSIQGEGLWIGERHLFVRFLGCDMRCRYCDTPAALCEPDSAIGKFCTVQKSPASAEFEKIPNPVPADGLTNYCSRLVLPGPSRPTISLTGGEPLLHHKFLLEWLPQIKKQFRIYLETNGIHAEAMKSIRDLVDVVSMDFKLPSATGLRPFWDEHKQFLSAAKEKQLFVKAVVTKDTLLNDITTSASLIAGHSRPVPLVIQPAGGAFAPETAKLIEFQAASLSVIEDVRVIPQAHKMLHVP